MPGEARERERRAAARDGEARDLGEAARDERGARVVAEAEPVDRAGGDRDDVLQRAAALDADDVVARVRAQVGRVEAAHHDLARRRRFAAMTTAVGRWAASSLAKLGPLRNARCSRACAGSSSASTSSMNSSESFSMPFVALHDRDVLAG